MAVTVAGKNYTQISGCETTSDGGSWAGVDLPDGTNVKEGTYSLCGTLKSTGDNDAVFTPSVAVDMSGTKHLRCWYLCTSGGLLNTFAAGGIQIGISDGANECFWYLAGRDTYAGGWINLVVDVSSTEDSGTKPSSMNAITTITIRNNQASGKNVDNVWVDNLCLCDGLVAYGDDGGGYFDFDDIFSADDDPAALGIGIVRKIAGQYFLAGSLEWGDGAGTNGCKFQAKSQVVVFEDRQVNADLYAFDVVDNGTGTTEFILGDKSGTAGIQGCTVRVESSSQLAKFDIDGSTDTDVDNFKLYASIFYGADSITFPGAAATVEILGCSFELCAQVDPDDASVSGCFFINTSDVDAALLWNEDIDIDDCSFIANTTGAGIEMPSDAGTPYAYDALFFSGNTYDVLNSSGSPISINKNDGSDPTTYEGSSVTFLGISVTTQITVKDVTDSTVIENVRVLLEAADAGGPLNFEEAVTSINRVTTTATVAHTAHGLTTNDLVHIIGTNQPEYNIVAEITVTGVDAYTYQVSGSPATPATGTIKSTEVMFNDLTNASGIVTDTRAFASSQNMIGRARKSTSSPLYKTQPIIETIDKDNGLTLNVLLIPDE